MKNSLSPVGRKPEARAKRAKRGAFVAIPDAGRCAAFAGADNFVLGGPHLRPQYGRRPPGLRPSRLRDACRGRVMDDERGESSRRPISLALACVAAVGWLIAATVWWQSSETQSQLNQSLTAAERARESLAVGPAKPAKDGRNRSRPEKAGRRRRESALGRLGRKGVGAKRTCRSDQADQRRQARHFRRPGRGERQDARPASRRLQAEGRNRPRRGAWEPGSGPFNRAVSPPGRRRDGAQGSRGGSDRDRRRAEGLPGASGPDQRGGRRAQRHRGANSRRKAGTEFDPTQPEPVTGSPDVGASLVHGDCAARRPVFKHRMAGKSRGPRRARPQRRRLHG